MKYVDDEDTDFEQLFDIIRVADFNNSVSEDDRFIINSLANSKALQERRPFETYLNFQKWLTEKAKRGYTIVSIDVQTNRFISTEVYLIFWNKDK